VDKGCFCPKEEHSWTKVVRPLGNDSGIDGGCGRRIIRILISIVFTKIQVICLIFHAYLGDKCLIMTSGCFLIMDRARWRMIRSNVDIFLMDKYRIMDRIKVLMDRFFIGIILIIKKINIMDGLHESVLILSWTRA